MWGWIASDGFQGGAWFLYSAPSVFADILVYGGKICCTLILSYFFHSLQILNLQQEVFVASLWRLQQGDFLMLWSDLVQGSLVWGCKLFFQMAVGISHDLFPVFCPYLESFRFLYPVVSRMLQLSWLLRSFSILVESINRLSTKVYRSLWETYLKWGIGMIIWTCLKFEGYVYYYLHIRGQRSSISFSFTAVQGLRGLGGRCKQDLNWRAIV